MNVQLILFPQSNLATEFLTDGTDFSTIDFATNYDISASTNTYVDIQTNAPATPPNSWRRYRNTTNGTPALPDGTAGGNLVLNAIVQPNTTGKTGVYQQLTGLTLGESYKIRINFASLSGEVQLARYNGTTGDESAFTDTSSITSFTFDFVALSTNDTVFLTYRNTVAADFIVSEMSVGIATASEYEGQVICDLYEDEEIPLTLSVDNFKNVAEKIQSYSKDFNLPATKRNNKIFSNIFEITRTVSNPYDFNPYIITRAVLKQSGVLLFDGYLRLIDVQDREGEISYNVNLYAQTIALADTLKNKTFDDIDFSELSHTYDKTTIQASAYTDGLPLTNPLPAESYAGTAGASVTDVLKYPFVDWTGQILIANGATGNSATLGNPELTSLEQAFRPFIKIKYLIDRIFSEAGYTYSSTLFTNTASFQNLFMDFNWGGNEMAVVLGETSFSATYFYNAAVSTPTFENLTSTFQPLPLLDNSVTGSQTTSTVPPDYETTGTDINKIVSTSDNSIYNISYTWFLKHQAGSAFTTELQWRHYDDSTATTNTIDFYTESTLINDIITYTGNINIALDTDDVLWAEYRIVSPGTGANIRVSQSQTSTATFNVSSSIVNTSIINSLRGEINQWDFIKGIFTMFNLVTLQDKSNSANIIIESYKDVFINTGQGTTLAQRGISHDWTNKVDVKDIKLTPLNDLNKTTIFKFEEDEDDYIFKVYKKSTSGHLYGSKVFSASGLTLLEGTDEIVASPFAATISKPINQSFTDMIIPTIYSVNDDGEPSSFDNKPRILFNSTGAAPITLASSYYIPDQNGQSSANATDFFTFSHLTEIPTTTNTEDFNFGECQLITPIGASVSNNLFNNNWLPYYNQLYDSDTKTMEIKVNLNEADIYGFEFSDYVMIKNRAYRVNRIDYNPKELSLVEFILII